MAGERPQRRHASMMCRWVMLAPLQMRAAAQRFPGGRRTQPSMPGAAGLERFLLPLPLFSGGLLLRLHFGIAPASAFSLYAPGPSPSQLEGSSPLKSPWLSALWTSAERWSRRGRSARASFCPGGHSANRASRRHWTARLYPRSLPRMPCPTGELAKALSALMAWPGVFGVVMFVPLLHCHRASGDRLVTVFGLMQFYADGLYFMATVRNRG